MAADATLAQLSAALVAGQTTSTALVSGSLQRIEDAGGDGDHAFVRVYETQAMRDAAACDRLIASGAPCPPLTGIPISIKDVFDVPGEATTAGSVVLDAAPPAVDEATVIRRLRMAGAVIIGKTNMTEFAYSTLGLNTHYGTPRNPFDPSRIPGGSSSGAAASVAYGYCAGAIGTDTAGSVRIPAAFCGLVGFKPTQRRVPREGTLPLALSLDSIGPVASSTACCALLDAIMAGIPPPGSSMRVPTPSRCSPTPPTATIREFARVSNFPGQSTNVTTGMRYDCGPSSSHPFSKPCKRMTPRSPRQ